MKITRKSELIIERERSITVKFGAAASERFCRVCAGNARFITVDEAAILRGTSSRRIFLHVETDHIHSIETADGLLLVCFASLVSTINVFTQTPIKKRGEQTDDSINL